MGHGQGLGQSQTEVQGTACTSNFKVNLLLARSCCV